ncbi:ADP-ribosylglycohydrolase family protein [Tengunoibacter tsumagoiensis]|nr:ADP-ribosylglycohydrolase family protein [Tengunoibacter tsumagoiensis]
MVMHSLPLERARLALEGLSVGDAFGERFFLPQEQFDIQIQTRQLPPPIWRYSDDTQMALSVLWVLQQHGQIKQAQLAASFAEHFDPSRGYGPGAQRLLRSIREGQNWQEASSNMFEGQGSHGNGAAMRVAPIGAYFADDLERVIFEAARSAEITHAHPEGIAGGIAVAVASAQAWRLMQSGERPTRSAFIERVVPFVPVGKVKARLLWASQIAEATPVETVAKMLGNGIQISAADTVPFALWCAGEHLDNYEEALWLTAQGGGDVDTTCAIVGGIVALYSGRTGIPPFWLQAREALPDWPFTFQ